MRVKILAVEKKPFKSNTGETIDYFWHTALRIADDVQIVFGSMRQHNQDEEADLNIVKKESDRGKIRYTEVV